MLDFKRKRQIRNMVFSYVTVAVLGVLIFFMAMSVFERFTVEREMAERREEAEIELQALRQRAAALEAQVEYLEDERGMEAEIRDRFDVVKAGEQVVIILDDENAAEAKDTKPAVEPDEPWYKFW